RLASPRAPCAISEHERGHGSGACAKALRRPKLEPPAAARRMNMSTAHAHPAARFVHVVTLDCKDAEHALRCIQMLTRVGLPDAKMFQCVSYEFGLEAGSTERVVIIQRWERWEDLDALIEQRIAPDL